MNTFLLLIKFLENQFNHPLQRKAKPYIGTRCLRALVILMLKRVIFRPYMLLVLNGDAFFGETLWGCIGSM